MSLPPCARSVTCLLGLVLVCAGCGKAPPPPPAAKPPEAPVTIVAPPEAKPEPKVKASMVIVSSAETNPDRNGVPSPVVVRVYQLRRDVAFNRVEFLELFDDEKKALGADLITSDEFVLAPSERRTLDVVLAPDARFVGALAAFRDYRTAQWRAIVPAPSTTLSVSLERGRVVMSGN